MPDIAGFRAKLATIVPSTNTIVEADFNHLFRIPGVTFHTGRMYIERPSLDSNDAFAALLGQVDQAFETALRDVMTCEPDYLVMGMSAPTFWGGRDGNAAFLERARRLSGVDRGRKPGLATDCRNGDGGAVAMAATGTRHLLYPRQLRHLRHHARSGLRLDRRDRPGASDPDRGLRAGRDCR